MLEDHLLGVMKPARYIGQEWNSSRKDFAAAELRLALCFPDLYEVGMSNLGIRILYGLLNSLPHVTCERFFSPAADLEELLRKNNEPLVSLESRRQLAEFDFVGISLGHELAYTNVLNLLDLGKLPLLAQERDHRYPLVIGGGPCALNPEPVHAFFDLFVIGEGEEVVLEILELYSQRKDAYRRGEFSKLELLKELAGLEGVYVPSLYEVTYREDGSLQKFQPLFPGVPQTVKKRFVQDLNRAYFPAQWLIPYIQIVHDRITLEVMRGCPNRCRFCQARSGYYPFRVRSKENIVSKARELYACTGYDEISLIGLSVSDHPDIENILTALTDEFKSKGVSLSLPSIKPRALVGELARIIATIKKTGLTFAPEAASERMRNIINKDFDFEEFFRVLEDAYRAGYQHVKLYFLIGLPFEREEDLAAINKLAEEISHLGRKTVGRPAQVNVSVNALIPKPHTPFQWCAMDNMETVTRKQAALRSLVKSRRIKLSFHDARMSFLEGVLSRGDRLLSRVILEAYRGGARFDGWKEHFSLEIWQEAFKASGVDPDKYLQERKPENILAWDFIDCGLKREILQDEFNKVIANK